MTMPKEKRAKACLTEDQEILHELLRRWTSNPTNRTHLERLIDCMVEYELKAQVKTLLRTA